MRTLFLPRMTSVILSMACVFAAGCGNTIAVQSSEPSEPLTVDGELLEWSGSLNDIDNGAVSVGVQNDEQNLYVSLSSRDPRTVAQIMQAGMIMWIDPAGGKAETFGIRFPLGFVGDDQDSRGLGEGLAANRVRIERSTQEVEIIGENGQTIRRRKDAVPGLSVHVEADQQALTYELQVPLGVREGVLYAVEASPGDEIGIGLTTPDIYSMNEAGMPGSGGLPGGRMSSADGRGGYRGMGGQRFAPDAMNHWLVVKLAGGG